jgi:hypothetical protein
MAQFYSAVDNSGANGFECCSFAQDVLDADGEQYRLCYKRFLKAIKR